VGTDGSKKWRIVYCRSSCSARKRRCASPNQSKRAGDPSDSAHVQTTISHRSGLTVVSFHTLCDRMTAIETEKTLSVIQNMFERLVSKVDTEAELHPRVAKQLPLETSAANDRRILKILIDDRNSRDFAHYSLYCSRIPYAGRH
jgi:hypothetical protein